MDRSGPPITAIAGGSCSGKSTLAAALCARCPERSPALLGMDAYYLELRGRSEAELAAVNFDAPEALDWELLLAHVRALAAGGSVARPVYRFDTHARTTAPEPVGPGGLIVVEGLHALLREELRELVSLAVFVDAPGSTCVRRRLERDVALRGRSRESVVRRIATTVEPMYRLYVEPSRAWADLVLDGTLAPEANAAAILGRLDGL